MITEEELERLLQTAMADCRSEPAFLYALLDATLHTLAPLSDDHPRLRLWMFRRPDGVHFIPYFTNERQARESAVGQLRVVSMPGKLLLEVSRGATVMINPNNEAFTLYPEEIDALLVGKVAVISQTGPREGGRMLASPASDPPRWLITELCTLYARLRFVERAWLISTCRSDSPDKLTMTVCIEVTPSHRDRAAHATITALQQRCADEDFPLDVIASDPDDPLDATMLGLLIYTREEGCVVKQGL